VLKRRAQHRISGVDHWFAHAVLLTLLGQPAPSGSTGTSGLCRGRLPPSPVFPGSGCPKLLPDRCDDPRETVSHHLSIYQRLVAHFTGTQDEHDGGIVVSVRMWGHEMTPPGDVRRVNNLALHALTAAFAPDKAIVNEKAARIAITEIAAD
jgi:hypothetical protein